MNKEIEQLMIKRNEEGNCAICDKPFTGQETITISEYKICVEHKKY